MKELTSIGDVVRKIVEDFGEESLLNTSFTLAAFMDLAPKLKTERELLRAFMMCNGVNQVIKIKNMPNDEQYKSLENVICKLEHNHGLSEKAACHVCKEVYRGITGQVWNYIPVNLDVYKSVTVERSVKNTNSIISVEVNGKIVVVTIPGNAVNGQTICFQEKGKRDVISGKTGNLYITVTIIKTFFLDKRIIAYIGIAFAIVMLLSNLFKGCNVPTPTEEAETSHAHSWKAATCATPQKCTLCGETSGSVAEHSWKDATCTEPKTCTVCGETIGIKLAHQWKEATSNAPAICKLCGKEEEYPLEEAYLYGGQMHNGEEFYMDSYEFLIWYTEDLRLAGFADCDFECMGYTNGSWIYEIKNSEELLLTLRSKDNAENGNMILAELSFVTTGLTETEIEKRISMMLKVFETGDINIDAKKVEGVLTVDDIKDNRVAFPMGRIEGLGYILTYPENGIALRILPQN